jgi:hypothetical protein
MSYPQILDYNEAVQTPQYAFSDPVLQGGLVRTSPLGLPLALSGGFALTYTVEASGRKFAVRCFHREMPTIQSRYKAISAALAKLTSPYFVAFDFQPTGIRVRGQGYPIVKMDWVEGDTLGVFLDKRVRDRSAISNLRQRFFDLSEYLEHANIAHGDIQNENVMVTGGNLRLIDYDGMYVDGIRKGAGTEIGHKHFQHPSRELKDFGPKIDRFSFIVIDVSLAALESDPNLHARYREGGTTILFKANDFADPDNSDLFSTLAGYSSIASSVNRLAEVCKGSLADTPTLSDFRSDRNIPNRSASRPAVAVASGPREVTYISAFTVVDAATYADVVAQMGNRIELIGKIVSVHEGIGKRGRSKGKPYLFINFGNWLGNSVKLTIWSDGLQNFGAKPDSSWVGRWVSATGLIDPPYTGKHYGRPYTNIGITIGDQSQVVQISDDEALFRLGRKRRFVHGHLSEPIAKPTNAGASSGKLDQPKGGARSTVNNTAILQGLGIKTVSQPPMGVRNTKRVQPATSPWSTPTATKAASNITTKNAAILATLNGGTSKASPSGQATGQVRSTPTGAPSPPRTPAQIPVDKPSIFARIPGWLWVAAAVGALLLLGR